MRASVCAYVCLCVVVVVVVSVTGIYTVLIAEGTTKKKCRCSGTRENASTEVAHSL